MNDLSPAQKNSIQTWAEQRDALLREIGIYSTELGIVQKKVKDGKDTLQDVTIQIATIQGRLAELDALEEQKKNSLSLEVAELEARKSRLESECAEKEKESLALSDQKKQKLEDIQVLQVFHDKMSDQAKIVNQMVGQIVETSTNHVADMRVIMSDIKQISTEVINKGNENIAQTGIILEKLPRFIFELQKPIPVRRYSDSRTRNGIDRDMVELIKKDNQLT